MAEHVNHPQHYGGDVPHETYKCLRAWGLESDALIWNAVKYLSRAGKKGSRIQDRIQDLEKSVWYVKCRIDQLKAEDENNAVRRTKGVSRRPNQNH